MTKNIYRLLYLSPALLVVLAFVSCNLDDDNSLTSPECAITSFSVGDISCVRHTTSYQGNDSTYNVTVSGSSITFNINQLTGEIYSIDSLASWVDITHVVPSITSNGTVYFWHESDSLYYAFSADSVDFTTPQKFAVVAYDGKSYKEYTASIKKRSVDSGTLTWNDSAQIDIKGDFKVVELGGNIVVLNDSLSGIDYGSIVVFGSMLYGLDNAGKLQSSQDGTIWTSVECTKDITRLVAADGCYLYGIVGDSIMKTADFTTWAKAAEKHMDMLPTKSISYLTYASSVNDDIENVVMIGECAGDTQNVKVWRKITSSKEDMEEMWNYVAITSENQNALPVMQMMSNVVRYNSYLYVFGDGYFFCSKDGGITWDKKESSVLAPTGLTPDRQVRLLVKDGEMYLYQSGEGEEVGKVWKGVIGV